MTNSNRIDEYKIVEKLEGMRAIVRPSTGGELNSLSYSIFRYVGVALIARGSLRLQLQIVGIDDCGD
jgi:hypothetical protein